MKQPGLKLVFTWDAGVTDSDLTGCATVQALEIIISRALILVEGSMEFLLHREALWPIPGTVSDPQY